MTSSPRMKKKNQKNNQKQKQKQKLLKKCDYYDLNELPLFSELIGIIASYLPVSWIHREPKEYDLKTGDLVQIEKLYYGNLKGKCWYGVPPNRNFTGVVIDTKTWESDYGERNHEIHSWRRYYGQEDHTRCVVKFYKLVGCTYRGFNYSNHNMFAIDKNCLRLSNMPDKKKIKITKGHIIKA
jgi:hypothetical protein